MSNSEPIYQHQDTQPTAPDLRPTDAIRCQLNHDGLPMWLLIGIILFSGVSLIATIAFSFTLGQGQQDEATTIALAPEQLSIILIVGNSEQVIETRAATVGDLLREKNIALGQNDAISYPRNTLLRDEMRITISRVRDVLLTIDDVERFIQTPLENPQAILASQNIALRPADRLWLNNEHIALDTLSSWSIPVDTIEIRRAISITLQDGDSTQTLTTTADTVGDALYEAGIDLFVTDIVEPSADTTLVDDMIIQIDRAKPVVINVDGNTINTRVAGQTVADTLSEAGITLAGLDYAIPAETELVQAATTINVIRVTASIESREENLPFETVYQANGAMELDTRNVTQTGITGIQRHDERVRYENGEEISREPAGTTLIRATQNQVIEFGTNVVLRPINTPEGTQQYWRKLRVYATSYKPESVGGSTTTAIGMTLQKGIIGADPTIIPYRTNMYVQGYGVGIMADTGGARSSPYWIDLGYSDEDFEGWHWYTDVYLLAPVPENINYLLPNWRPMRGLPDN